MNAPDWKLIKCAFGKHNPGRILHDDIMDRWIVICKSCNHITVVDPPKDANGKPIDPHEYLRCVNIRDIDQLERDAMQIEGLVDKFREQDD